ncbi:MAG: putative sulfate exporter family transporter [Myxococcota bacterium]
MRAWQSEDWWSVWLGFAILGLATVGVIPSVPKVSPWVVEPQRAWAGQGLSLALLAVGLIALTALTVRATGKPVKRYAGGAFTVFVLATLAQAIGAQQTLREYGLGYALWALALGLLIANTMGTPPWLRAGARSELFIKVGLVLLGAELLVSRIIELGGPGLMVAYLVTPVIIVIMWLFGTRVLRMRSKALTIIIACATSVCGVSAAVAVAAAVRAKKEELTLGVGLTMIFTVAMMVGMPALCGALGLSPWVAGAWIGGTVDSTGAVVAAGAMLGDDAEQVAAIVKMIQNTMIGGIAFVIAVYWVTRVEGARGGKPSVRMLWDRFPKFVLGFLLASLVASFFLLPVTGPEETAAITKVTKGIRGWLFAMAFVSIGLESNFRRLTTHLRGGKPIVLYAVGQTVNIVLTLLVAWIAFGGVLFQLPA